MADYERKQVDSTEDELAGSGSSSLASKYGINQKKLTAKLDFRLLPPVVLLYLLSFLDRSNGALRQTRTI